MRMARQWSALLSNEYKSDLGLVCLEILETWDQQWNSSESSYGRVTEIGA